MNNLPGLRLRRFNLKEHAVGSEVDPGLAVARRKAVFVGEVTEMIKLIIENLRDIFGELLPTIPEEPGETVHIPGGGAGVKLSIEGVPVTLVGGEYSHYIYKLCVSVLHLKLEVLQHEELHGELSIINAVHTADFINILFVKRLKPNCTLCFFYYLSDVRRMRGSGDDLAGRMTSMGQRGAGSRTRRCRLC